MKLNEVREKFLKFFINNNHQHIPSSPLIPENDPTLMFTNAGMVQFKNIFTGKQQTDIKRAVSSQKCLRVGGKHNDLETVGYTSRHHTFFEMLGNFSFGDYFKETAIELAWNFITKELSLEKDRLSITVYHTDDEAYKIWRKVSGLKDEKIIRISTDDNFWSMGNTGPCGPCSEIFYDHVRSDLGHEDRVVEIWNLVFMEFDKDKEGNLRALPKKCIDTGMGIERITAVLQNVHDNYDIDFFAAIISQAQKYCKSRIAHKIIADHLRAAAFLISEGVLPGNEGRSYVLRRLVRRAARYFECDDPLLYRIFSALINSTSPVFTETELLRAKDLIEATLKAEEENFKDTLTKGVHMLEKYTADLNPGTTLAGELVFKLYDTYGFPVDITLDILKEKKINFDHKGFDDAMHAQKTRSKWFGSGAKSVEQVWFDLADKFGSTKFVGYENNETNDAKVLNIISSENEMINAAYIGNKVTIILDKTPFYGESGGQIGDTGTILNTTNNVAIVENTRKIHNLYLHQCVIKSGTICNGDIVIASIDHDRRRNLCRNHSATHLLHFALRSVLGNQVIQKGSLVASDRLRFDFSYNTQVNHDQLYLIENIVNNLIRENRATFTRIQNMDQAVNEGAIALFGEKYSDQVRVVNIGNSKELCGGTHVQHTGEIGLFKIVTESSVAFGIRRIEALTGQEAINYIRNNEITLKKIAEYVKVPVIDVTNRLTVLNQERKKSETKIKSLYERIVKLENIKSIPINGINFLSKAFIDIPADIIRGFILHQHIVKTVIAFTTSENKKNILIVRVSKDLTDIMSAKTLITNVVNKNCGGTAELAQVGYHNGDPITSIYNCLRDKI